MSLPEVTIPPLCVPAITANLIAIRKYVRSAAATAGLPEMEAQAVALAVDEACANLIQHAYKNDFTKQIGVSITYTSTEFVVKISDTSTPFDPKTAPLPDMRRYFLEHRHHGLGVLLMTRVMDSIEYVPATNGTNYNTLTLVKQR
ncbi:MAG: ATP-binding protein [Bradyrhizobiaceae bacterium]|nr:ATP-binding protein [Bradyrhizobiaceae bacterium]